MSVIFLNTILFQMDIPPPPDLNLSEMLIKHLAEQANMKTAPVPILTVSLRNPLITDIISIHTSNISFAFR